MKYKEEIIVLKNTKLKESDLIIHGLTRKGTRISLLARGAVKSKKRFAGGILEPTHHIEVVYEKKENQDIGHLLEAQMLHAFDTIRSSYERINCALACLKIVDQVSLEEVTDGEKIFALLAQGLVAIEKSNKLNLFTLHFQIKLLHFLGFLELDENLKAILNCKIKDHESLALSDQQIVLLQKQVTWQFKSL